MFSVSHFCNFVYKLHEFIFHHRYIHCGALNGRVSIVWQFTMPFLTLQLQLVKRIESLEKEKQDEVCTLQECVRQIQTESERQKSELSQQLHQHSETVLALEEQLDRTVQINKEYQTEIATLKKTNLGMSVEILIGQMLDLFI